MTSVPPRRRNRREHGVTVCDVASTLAIVGIVAVTMVFALGGVTSRSALALCQQQGSTTATAILRYDASNPGAALTNGNFLTELTTSESNGGPYLKTWPSNFPHYAFTVIDGTLWVFTGNALSESTPPVVTALSANNLAPGALRADNVMDSTADWINYDKYGADACDGVQ